MEKLKPHYLLKAIQAQMTVPEAMNLTLSALSGIRAAGMAQTDALAVVQGLTAADFFKSMTTQADHRVWHNQPLATVFGLLSGMASSSIRMFIMLNGLALRCISSFNRPVNIL